MFLCRTIWARMVSKRHAKMLVVIYGDVVSNITPFSDWSECRRWRIQMPTGNFSPSAHAFATGKLKSNWMIDVSKLSDVVANDMNIANWNWFWHFRIDLVDAPKNRQFAMQFRKVERRRRSNAPHHVVSRDDALMKLSITRVTHRNGWRRNKR